MKDLPPMLAELEKKVLRRSLRVVEQVDGPRLTIEGRTLLNFSSNNYLGLARHPQVLEAVSQVLPHWGAGATASRLVSGTSVIHQDLEKALAAFVNKEAALLFPSGYMANLGVVSALVEAGDAVIVDRLNHASLIDAARLSGARLFVYQHADPADAEKILARTQSYRRRLLVTESLYSMDGDFAPVRDLSDLARQYGAISLLDEAHALGVWGFHGQGVLGLEGMDAPWDIVVGTLSKALGSQGGFVAGSQALIDTLVNRARSFIFTTGLSPACVAAAQAALSLIQDNPTPRVQLQRKASRLREGLALQGWNIFHSESQIVPIFLGEAGDAVRCSDVLFQVGIFAPAIRPPTVPAGQCRIRFSVTAEHSEEDIDTLLEVLMSFPRSQAGIHGSPPSRG